MSEVGIWHSMFRITLSNCTNIKKKFLKKVHYRGRCSLILKMCTDLRKKCKATTILRPHPCHHHHFGTKNMMNTPWKSQFESFIGFIRYLVFCEKKYLQKVKIRPLFVGIHQFPRKGRLILTFQKYLFTQNAKYVSNL